MTDLTAVADRFAIQDVMSNYAAGVDERDLDRYRDCFADDVVIVGFGAGPTEGADQWVSEVIGKLEAFGATQHMLGPVYAEIKGDHANVRTDVQALHYMAEDPETTLTLWATYVTEMKKIEGAWKISRHELVRRGTRVQKG
jgi:ketosteroid isomerase-like protein